MIKFRVYTFDTCGNARDGFEVNDRFSHGEIEVSDCSPRVVFKALREASLVVDSKKVCIGSGSGNYMGGHLDIEMRRNGKPLGFLERVSG
jgi:hypothetical protein